MWYIHIIIHIGLFTVHHIIEINLDRQKYTSWYVSWGKYGYNNRKPQKWLFFTPTSWMVKQSKTSFCDTTSNVNPRLNLEVWDFVVQFHSDPHISSIGNQKNDFLHHFGPLFPNQSISVFYAVWNLVVKFLKINILILKMLPGHKCQHTMMTTTWE